MPAYSTYKSEITSYLKLFGLIELDYRTRTEGLDLLFHQRVRGNSASVLGSIEDQQEGLEDMLMCVHTCHHCFVLYSLAMLHITRTAICH